jgi:hypothetical protein
VEIYEGDIVKFYYAGYFEQSDVFFDEGCFSVRAYNNDPSYTPCLQLIPQLDIEVIGNVHEKIF